MKNNRGFVLTETIVAFSLTLLVIISSSLIIMIISQSLSHYTKINQEKILADSAFNLIKENLSLATNVKINTVDTLANYFKIENGALKNENGYLYDEEHYKNNPMQIEINAKDYGMMHLTIKILDKNNDPLYSTSRTFKILYLNKLRKGFSGQTGIITNPTIYYEK